MVQKPSVRGGGGSPPPSPDEDVDGVRVESSAREERVHMGGDEVGRDTAGGDAAGEGTAGEDTAGEGTAGGDTAGDTAIEGTAGGHVAAGDKTGADVMSAAAADEVSVPFFGGGGDSHSHNPLVFHMLYPLCLAIYQHLPPFFLDEAKLSLTQSNSFPSVKPSLVLLLYQHVYQHSRAFVLAERGRKEGGLRTRLSKTSARRRLPP